MSAVWIVVSGLLAIMLTGIGTYVALPVLFQLYNSSEVQNLPDDSPAKRAADTNYQIGSIMAMLFMGAIFLNMYARATRKDSTEEFV